MVIVKTNLKRIFKSKMNVAFFILLPVMLMYMMVQMQMASNTYRVAVVDYDQTELSNRVIEKLKEISNIVDVEEGDIKNGLLESRYDYAIVIPKGLMESAEVGKDVQIEGYGIMESNVSVPVKYMLRSYLSSAIVLGGLKKDKADYLDMLREYEEGKVVYEIKDISDKEATIKSNFVLALGISVMCILLLLTFSTTLIIKDKDSRMYERILSGPTSKAKYNGQHILTYFLVSLVQVLLLIYLAKVLSNMEIGEEIIKIICLFVVFSLVAVTLGIAISNFTKNTRQANAIISLITIPMSMLGGCLWDRNMMPEVMQNIANAVPTTWVMKGVDSVVSGTGNYGICLAALFGFLLVFFGLSLIGQKR